MLITLLSYSFYRQDGWTALMWAAQGGHLEVVIKLAELGVNLAATNNVSLVNFM